MLGGPDLGSHGDVKAAPIASMAKLMTVYVLLHRRPTLHAGAYLIITAADVRDTEVRKSQDQSLVPVRAGERLTETETLEAILLPSANNIAVYAGVSQLGSSAAFVKQMNVTAGRLGMTSTHYTDASGFLASTVSTAPDQLRLMKAVTKVPELMRLAGKRSATIPVAGLITNTAPVGPGGFLAAKTGSDDDAGGCLAFAEHIRLNSRVQLLVGVVMGQTGGPLIAVGIRSARRLADSVGPNAEQ